MTTTLSNPLQRLFGVLTPIRRIDASIAWGVGIVALSILAWIACLIVMGGMDQGPRTPLHDFPTFLIGWVIMLTAMMLPSEILYVKVYATLLEDTIDKRDGRVSQFNCVTFFIAGYGIAWIGYGMIAFILDAIIRANLFEFIALIQAGPMLAGSVLFLAGVYQVSSLKHACLTHCRSPLSYFARNWRDGCLGGLRMGLSHGFVCVGCCWALMAVMFAVGAMNLIWMGLLTLLMFAEKIFPFGPKLAIPIAVFLWAMGVWIAISPEFAPLLQNPLLFDPSIFMS
ncbi:MAG: DUF2182 domain-containing protein [Leptolyngbyaceae cyanobacterium MO_188.B28]|nr:DUF2182 domain-containing protein [Leptolyngbyaceae cyanobacterium MO_188.B28]